MISTIRKIPGATYTADTNIAVFDCNNDLGGAVMSVSMYVDMGAITTATAVDLVWSALYGGTNASPGASKAYGDCSLANNTDQEFVVTADNAEIDDPATGANGSIDSVPIAWDRIKLAIDATWGGGSAVINDIYCCFIVAPKNR